VVPVQLSVPFVKAQITPEPVTFTLLTASLEPPAAALLVRVTVPEFDKTPEASVMLSGFGAMETAALVAVPAPVGVTGEFVTVAPV
jgi:hypothetical protein